MRLLALTRYGRMGGSSRLRSYQYIDSLKEHGVELQVAPLLRNEYLQRLYAKQPTRWREVLCDYLHRVKILVKAGSFDALWIEKELFPNFPAFFEEVLAALGIPYVVDFDDATFHNYDNARFPKSLLAKKIDSVMRSSALVTCGNNYLAQRARDAGASRVEILPTVIDLERYSVAAPTTDHPIVVGWIGSPSTVKYLDIVMPALHILARDIPVHLRVIGACFSSDVLEVECKSWSEESEVREIQQIDVGIMPLTDSRWERGKCGYKLIQYMACGLPVVASPVGVNSDIVKHAQNGYLANTIDDWVTALRALCRDQESRTKMGMVGRQMVESQYCLQVTAPRLANLLKALR